MSEKYWFVVAYDVRDERRLRKVAKKLEGYGTRQQLSVFRCRLTPREMERLRWELLQIMAPEDDLLCIRLCPRCSGLVWQKNQKVWQEDDPSFVIIG